MKVSYQGPWHKKSSSYELGGDCFSDELCKIYEYLIEENEQVKRKPLHDKLIELNKLDWELYWKHRERNTILKQLNESR